ncbi:MAG TPA: hypothetical protein VMD27_02080 [Candidatus Aquilonibacter sp.]|nr:hypothetical protein [Candidatus Aquilonibacter sp.]
MKKIIIWSVVGIIIVGIAAAAFWWLRRPQVITLNDGTKLTLLAVTYGRHQVLPRNVKTASARNQRAPVFNTPNNTLVVWIRQEHPANHWPNYQLYLYDKAGTACVGNSGQWNNYGGGTNEIVAIQFNAFPRRQGKFIVRVQEYIQNEGQVLNEKHFVISNPAHNGSFPDWTAESLPVTKTDGDFSVTLAKLNFGVDANFNRDQDNPDDAINKGVEAVFQVQQNGTNAVNWQPAQIETSDATGNHQSAGCSSHWDGDNLVADYQWGLWPGEPWKLRVEFSKQSGFTSDELLTVTNIPFRPGNRNDFWNWSRSRTNTPFAEATVNGVLVKIYPAQQFADEMQPSAVLLVRADSLPEGMQLTLLKLTDSQGNDIDHWGWSTDAYGMRDIEGVTNLTVTIAVHQDHFFEFTAKPGKVSASDDTGQ